MSTFLLTQYQGSLLGPIAKVLGLIINAIYNFLETVGIPNIGLSIILFTIVVNILMLPFSIKTQKFQKLQAKMNPEIQAIQKKYKNKKDNASIQKMNDEMNLVYEKYGTSPTGGCLPMLIQMPILFALFRVIHNIPAYIDSVKAIFTGLVNGVIGVGGFETIMQNFVSEHRIAVTLNFETVETTKNTLIDAFYLFKDSDWQAFASLPEFSKLGAEIDSLTMNLSRVNNFLGLNIAETPWNIVKAVLAGGSILLAIGAIMIPVLSAVTQVIQTKMMPQTTSNDPNDQNANMMKSMNTTMPLMSLFFCFTFQIGLGIYWIASSVVRCIIQIILNKLFDKVDVEDIIAKNKEKADKKKAKRGYTENQISSVANQNMRNLNKNKVSGISSENEDKVNKVYQSDVKPGSIAARARMVQKYNDEHHK